MNTKTDSTTDIDNEDVIEATVAKKPRKESRGKLTKVKLLRGIEDGEKITPQIKQLIEAALDAHGIEAEITTEEFITSLDGKLTKPSLHITL